MLPWNGRRDFENVAVLQRNNDHRDLSGGTSGRDVTDHGTGGREMWRCHELSLKMEKGATAECGHFKKLEKARIILPELPGRSLLSRHPGFNLRLAGPLTSRTKSELVSTYYFVFFTSCIFLQQQEGAKASSKVGIPWTSLSCGFFLGCDAPIGIGNVSSWLVEYNEVLKYLLCSCFWNFVQAHLDVLILLVRGGLARNCFTLSVFCRLRTLLSHSPGSFKLCL